MTPEDAEKTIIRHSFPCESPDARSFLGDLRPYPGHLYESSFLEIMNAIRALEAPYENAESVNKEVVAAICHICWYARFWGLHEDGMLQRNGLIAAGDADILQEWIDRISQAACRLFSGENADVLDDYVPLGDR